MPLILSKTTDPLIGSDPVESGPGLSWPLNVLDDNIKEKEAESTTCCGKIKLVYFVIQGFVLVLLLYLGVVHLLKKRPQEDVISGNSHRNNKEFHPKEIGQPIDPYFILTGNFNYSGCIVACLESCSYVAAIHSTQEDDDILDILGAHGHGSAWIGMAQFDRDWLNQDSTPVNYFNWDRGEPRNEKVKEYCALISTETQKWKARECNEVHGLCACRHVKGRACLMNSSFGQVLLSYLPFSDWF